jgi:hypothetical protein
MKERCFQSGTAGIVKKEQWKAGFQAVFIDG